MISLASLVIQLWLYRIQPQLDHERAAQREARMAAYDSPWHVLCQVCPSHEVDCEVPCTPDPPTRTTQTLMVRDVAVGGALPCYWRLPQGAFGLVLTGAEPGVSDPSVAGANDWLGDH